MKFPIIVLLAAGALSAPFNLDEFNKWVPSFLEKDECIDPHLKEDVTTIYSYEGETLSTVQGSTSDSTGLKLRAKVLIHPQGACRYRMQINNPELLAKSKNQKRFQTAEESRKFSRELQAQDLIFQTSKGRITKLFPTAGEAVHVLNIKRGILSTLQLDYAAKEETDVNGHCKVDIFKQDGFVYKSKQLSDCTERAHNELGIQTATFAHSKMPIKPLNSTSTCAYSIEDSKIMSVECLESHIFRPFSAGYKRPAGAITTVKQILKHIGEKQGGRVDVSLEAKSTEGVSLVYEHESEEMKPDNSIVERIDNVMSALVDTAKKNNLAAKQSSAHEFTHLVNLMRKLDSKRMTPVMAKYFDCDKSGVCGSSDSDLKSVYRQYILDSLTYCGTPTCVSAVHDVIIDGEVTGEYMNMFLQGISLVAKPTKQMIKDVLNIASKKSSRQAFLSLGTLLRRYCGNNPEGCQYGKRNPVTQAELFLENKLGDSCIDEYDYERAEEILMALKAIGNAGRPTRAVKTLLKCAQNSQLINVTTSALEALRHMPCSEDVASILHGIYGDVSVNIEKRIQSYLALMKCPTESTIAKIVKQLKNEKSNQVGSFVLSHLDNIKKSSDPRHTRTQELLSSVFKVEEFKKFDLTMTRFSKALEGSLYSKYLRSGATVEGHVIYDSDNILPRSALFNMTANILDVPVNMIEMAARVEGVETLMEGLFGAYGYFPDDSIMKVFNVTFTKDDIQKLRSRRSAEEGIDENIADMHEKVNKKPTRPEGFLTMKVFGHEMRVFSYDDIMWAADEIDNMNVIELLLKVAKGGHKTFTKSVMFLEMTHTVPTAIGLPMKLKLTGSAVGSMEIDGKFDIRNMFWGPSSLEVKGYVRPSAVVEVSGQMGVHSHFIDTGIFVNTSMFTSQMMKGSVVYKEGQQFRINIDAPEEPIEFFNVSSTPYMFVDEEATLIEGASRRISPDFCLNSTMVLGLGVCTSMAVPVAFRDYEAPYFPLSGPAHFGMRLVKADPKLTTYQFLVSVSKTTGGSGRQLLGSFEIGTPGATYSRRMSGVIKYTETRKVRSLTIGSLEAKNNAEFTVSYHNDTNRFEVDFSTNVITNKPIKMKLLYFNDTSFIAKEMGILASAEYDWYKFQHVSKFVRKTESGSYLLHTKTTYWPKKHLTGEIEYMPKTKSLSVRMDANQLNQRLIMNGRFVSSESEKGLNFTVTSTMAKASVYAGIKNTDSEKKFIISTSCPRGIRHVFSWGYYKTVSKHELRFDADIAGRTAAVYAGYSNLRTGWHGVKIGASYQKNVIGVMTSYNMESKFDQQACVIAFYNDKRPAKTCLVLSEVPSTYETPAFKRLTWSVEVLKKTAEMTLDYKTTDSSYALTSTMFWQSKEMMKNTLELMYGSMWDSQLKMTSTIGKRSVSTRFFTKTSGDLSLFGVEALGFNQMVKLQGTYSKTTKRDAAVHGVIFEGWVNKKLPVSYTFLVEYSKKAKGVTSILKFKEYTAKSSLIWLRPTSSEYSIVSDTSITKKDFVIFANKMTDIFIIGDLEKAYKFLWEFTVWNKSFKYGYDITYENQSTESTSSYAITTGVDYAKNKRSSMKTTFSNSKELAEVVVDVNYLPGRKVSHFARYSKTAKQFDVSIEFLPKMFVKLMGRLDQTEGWKFTTDLKFSWADYERSMQWITSYVKKADIKGLNFEFTAFKQKFFVGAEYNKKSKTVIFTLTAFKRSIRLVTFWLQSKGLAGMKLTTEKLEGNLIVPTEIIETVVQFSKTLLAFEMRTSKKSYVKGIGIFDKSKGVASMELSVLKKNIFKIMGEYLKSQKTAFSRVFIMGKERFQISTKYSEEDKTVLLSFDALKKNWNIVFSGKWNAEKKEVTVGSEFMKRVIGFSARFDPYNYAAGAHVFYQKNIMGWSMLYDPKTTSLVYNVTLTPRLSGQVVFQVIDDHIISVTIQRKIGVEVVNEFVFKYELGSSASSFIFEWNKDTVQKIKDLVMPALKSGVKDVKDMLKKVIAFSKTLSTDVVVKGTAKVFSIINNADKTFDEFDFVAAKNRAGEMIVSVLKRTGKLTSDSLKMASKGLMKLHNKMPYYMEQTVKYSKEGMAIAKSTLESSYKIAMAAYKVAKNVTESGMPVVKTAVKLAKEFKIRGRTTEAILKDFIEMINKIVKSYKANLSKQFATLKADCQDYITKTKVPYTKRSIGEFYEEYSEKIKTFDVEKKTREWTKKIMEIKIKGMTVTEHLEVLMKKFNNFPEDVKKAVHSMIKTTRLNMKKMKKMIRKVDSFFQPMTRCLMKIQTSVKKHFGPLVTNYRKILMAALKKNFNDVYLPAKENIMKVVKFVNEVILPIVKPVKPLYMNIRDQLLAIEIMDYPVRTLLRNVAGKYKTQMEKKLSEMKTMMNSYAQKMKIDTSLTAEEIADKIIDRSVLYSKKAIDEIKRVYSERKQIFADVKARTTAKWNAVSDKISNYISMPIPDMIEEAFVKSGKISMSAMKEISSVLDQLAEIDVATPLNKAWTAHLEKIEDLGVNAKILKAIATAKKVNVTETILMIIKEFRSKSALMYKKIETAVKYYYTTADNVYKYIRSIPKKDFEEFYTEVETQFLRSQARLYELVKKMFYDMKKMTLAAKTEAIRLYDDYAVTYGATLKELYADVKLRSLLVYNDVKDDCVYARDLYKAIITGMVKEQYEKLQKLVKDKYEEIYAKAMAFYKKYEDKTWEEVAMNVYDFGQVKFEKVYAVANVRLERLRTVTKNAVEVMKTFYEKVMAIAMKEKARFEMLYNEKIKPEVTRMYTKAVGYGKTKGKEYYGKVMAAYEKVYAEALSVYESNKKLSIRQLYKKSTEYTRKMIEEYVKQVKAIAKENYGKVYARSMKLKQKIMTELLPVAREEFESIINQTLRASVIIANETIKAFTPHYEIVKEHSCRYFKDGKLMAIKYYTDAMKEGKKYMGDAKVKTIELYNKGLTQAKLGYGKLVSEVMKYMEKIKNHPKYLEIVNHEMYLKIKAYIEKMTKIIKEKISEWKIKVEEMKNHPKIEEIKDKFKEIMEDPQVKKFMQIMKQVKESGKFTMMKIKEKIIPVIKMIEIKIAKVPARVVAQITFFRQYPEECFWTSVKNTKKFVINAKSEAKTALKGLTEKTKVFLSEITDEPTKKFVAESRKQIMEAYETVKALPEKIKAKVMKIYKEQMEMMKARWAKVIAQWKSSALYPIVTHEVWSEIADEVMNHELVVEMKSLAKKGLKMAVNYNEEVITKVKEFLKNKKAALKAEYERLIAKYNNFLDETTLEDIVTKTVEMYGKMMVQREKIMKKLMTVYSEMKEKAMVYKTKVVEFGKTKYTTMKKMWEERYPKVMTQLKTAYKMYIVKMEAMMIKLKTYYKDMETKAIVKAKKMWDESLLKQKFVEFKGMTVGETVAALKKMPENVRMFYKRMSEVVRSEFDRLVKPHLNKVVMVAKFIGNEINETAVFVYKYYHLKENTVGLYKKAYEKITEVMPKVPVFTKDYLKKFAKMSLKGLHATSVYVDNMELKPYITKMKAMIPDVKKYVTVEGENGRISIRVTHPRDIEPRFSYHVENVKGKVNELATKIKTRTITITKKLLDDLKTRTMELRKDLNLSLAAHSKLAEHIKSRSTALKENGKKRSASLKNYINKMLEEWRKIMRVMLDDVKMRSTAIYHFTSAAVKSITSAESIPEAYERFQLHVENAKSNLRPLYTISKRIGQNILADIKEKYTKYFVMIKTATKQWRDGAEFRTAFKEVENTLKAAYNYARNEFNALYTRTVNTIKNSVAPEDVKIIKEYLATHKSILGKYAKQFYRFYKWNKIRLDRAIRRSKMLLRYRIVHPIMKAANPLRTYAMIFGKSHVMTFDGHYYDFVNYAKPDCTYLLARDFKNGNFTILSQKEDIIVKTPEMNIKIHFSGRVSGTVREMKSGVARTRVVKDLPIETEDGHCKIWKKNIKCSFKQGVMLRCDIDHFLCSVELSGWHYGKSQGLLGTNNNEMFDEFKRPDNTIATTITEHANSWLVSKDSECLTGQFGNEAPTCNKAPSDRCFQLFKTKTSPFAKHFETLDALPFLKACLIDSADCDNKEPAEISHCNATAAYRHMLYLKGVKAPKISECEPKTFVNGKKLNKGDTWTQKPTKQVDIVVMVSGRSTASKFRRSIASMLYSTNKNLAKMGFNTRYALISYGTGSKSGYDARSHTHSGEYFSNEQDIATAIKTMPYTGKETDSNDYYAAILRSSKMAFRPGATKLFFLFNFDQYKPSWFGPTLDETKFALKYEANATLFVFDDFSFKQVEDSDVLGKTASRVYLKPFRPVKMETELPVNSFTKLVRRQGGMFVNNLRPSQAKALTAALTDAAKMPLQMSMKTCQTCTMRHHTPICRSDITVEC